MVTHHFSDNLYAKEMFIPADSLIIQHKHEYDHLSILAKRILYALIETDNPKLKKFAISIGFKQKEEIVLNNNKQAYIYSRSI